MDGIETLKEINRRDKEGLMKRKSMKIIAASAIGNVMFKQNKESHLFDGFGKYLLS